jgi:hypothetical protein
MNLLVILLTCLVFLSKAEFSIISYSDANCTTPVQWVNEIGIPADGKTCSIVSSILAIRFVDLQLYPHRLFHFFRPSMHLQQTKNDFWLEIQFLKFQEINKCSNKFKFSCNIQKPNSLQNIVRTQTFKDVGCAASQLYYERYQRSGVCVVNYIPYSGSSSILTCGNNLVSSRTYSNNQCTGNGNSFEYEDKCYGIILIGWRVSCNLNNGSTSVATFSLFLFLFVLMNFS